MFPVSVFPFAITITLSICLLLIDRLLLKAKASSHYEKNRKTISLAFETTAFHSRLVVFKAQIKSMDEYGVCDLVDTINDIFIRDLLERRETLFEDIGFAAAASFYSKLATVEMYLNRAYSMASDGYLEQSKECLDTSIEHLQSLIKNS